MHINTTARHFEFAKDDRQFAHERLAKFQRFAQDIHEVHLVVTAERYLHVAEITLRLKQRDFAIREESPEVRRAIDLAADRVEEQLRRLHDRRIARSREGRQANGAANGGVSEPNGEDDDVFGDSGEA